MQKPGQTATGSVLTHYGGTLQALQGVEGDVQEVKASGRTYDSVRVWFPDSGDATLPGNPTRRAGIWQSFSTSPPVDVDSVRIQLGKAFLIRSETAPFRPRRLTCWRYLLALERKYAANSLQTRWPQACPAATGIGPKLRRAGKIPGAQRQSCTGHPACRACSSNTGSGLTTCGWSTLSSRGRSLRESE
jgi:hypothetical protein